MSHDSPAAAAARRPRSYIVLNEARSGSSWLQEISVSHPGIKVQFELDLRLGDSALACKECVRPGVPDSKRAGAAAGPAKWHPPSACGMSAFGSANAFADVAALAARHDAALVVLLRLNHVAHAVSSYRHFNKVVPTPPPGTFWAGPPAAAAPVLEVPWGPGQLARAVEEAREANARLLEFPARTGRPAHLIFYEDMKRRPAAVWAGLQRFLGLPLAPSTGEESALHGMEQRASDRPAIRYLANLTGLQAALGGEEWGDMLLDPGYDEAVNVTEAFERACRLHPGARMSWRQHECVDGALTGLVNPEERTLSTWAAWLSGLAWFWTSQI